MADVITTRTDADNSLDVSCLFISIAGPSVVQF